MEAERSTDPGRNVPSPTDFSPADFSPTDFSAPDQSLTDRPTLAIPALSSPTAHGPADPTIAPAPGGAGLKHPCDICPLRARALFAPFSLDELDFMRDFREGDVVLRRGETLFHQGDELLNFYTVLDGMGARYTTLRGGSRQLINFILPGDLVGLSGSLTGEAMATVEASTPMRLCRFRSARLGELFRTQPQRGYALTWIAAVEEHFLGETIATLGRRSGPSRLAWALLKLDRRLDALGLRDANGGVPFPYRQRDLADALGLSLVHTNKTLSRLTPIARIAGGRLYISNRKDLAILAEDETDAPKLRPLL
jgi:CRP/FNR family transcriptional regulator, anaerobic regulatory protein